MTEYSGSKVQLIQCPVCGKSERKFVLRKSITDLYKCPGCGLTYQSEIDPDFVSQYKDDVKSSTSSYYSKSETGDIKTFNERLDIIEKYTSKGHLLDIGCSVGTMLSLARERGWRVTGVEPNPRSADICKQKGIEVFNIFFDSSFSSDHVNMYDAVYLGDVIEHVTDPNAMIGNIMKVLTNGGVLMIITPDFEGRIARSFQVKPDEHILYFNKNSMNYLLNEYQLKVIEEGSTTRYRDLDALRLSSTFTNRPISGFIIRVLSLLHLNSIMNFLIKAFVRDELLVIAGKI